MATLSTGVNGWNTPFVPHSNDPVSMKRGKLIKTLGKNLALRVTRKSRVPFSMDFEDIFKAMDEAVASDLSPHPRVDWRLFDDDSEDDE